MNAFYHYAALFSLFLLCVSAILAFLRLFIGPSLPDRVVAVDVMSVIVICVIAVFAVIGNHAIYLDIVIALALISFLGTVAFAQFIEWQLSHYRGKRK